MNSMTVISAKNITKNYGSVKALKGMSFEVGRGEIFGVIGPDGAGKTTLFRVLTTLLLPDSGMGSVVGFDLVKDYKSIRKCVGYMPGRFSLYQDLSVEENLKVFASLFGSDIEENYHMIESIYSQLEPFKTRRASALSGGMKQRVSLARAFSMPHDILLMDEPFQGLDKQLKDQLMTLLEELIELDKKTVIMVTHDISEAKRLGHKNIELVGSPISHVNEI